MRPSLSVEIWSDVVCPWCYIGKRRFEKAAVVLADEVDLQFVFRPYQLDPTAAPGSSMPVAEAYARKFGGPERAAAIIEQITEVAAGDGLQFHLDRALRANTLLAHRVLWLAEAAGLQYALEERLLQAYFCDGADVGNPDVLAALAGDVGMPAASVRAFLDSDDGTNEVRSMLAIA
ncbi:MAG: DsbA family oxidoreductase, partial [Actinomycetota bacterium]